MAACAPSNKKSRTMDVDEEEERAFALRYPSLSTADIDILRMQCPPSMSPDDFKQYLVAAKPVQVNSDSDDEDEQKQQPPPNPPVLVRGLNFSQPGLQNALLHHMANAIMGGLNIVQGFQRQ